MEDIINEINEFYNQGQLIEIGFMTTREPPYVIKIDGNLGISVCILKDLYRHCLKEFENLVVLNQLDLISNHSERLKTLSLLLLVIKGDLPAAFKHRKLLVEADMLKVRDELYFTSLLFSKHPKSPSGWYHRRWCILRNLKNKTSTRNNQTLPASQIETEKQLCSTMAERNPKNYYAWTHRLWLLDHMSDSQVSLDKYIHYCCLH